MEQPLKRTATFTKDYLASSITGGISYVQASEDKCLGDIAYRADSNLRAYTKDLDRQKLLLRDQVLTLHCPLAQVAKKNIKHYVRHAKKRRHTKDLHGVKLFEDLDFTKNNIATVLHFTYSEEQVLKPAKNRVSANVLLIFWTYKSQQSREISERLCLELFVDEALWMWLEKEAREELKYFSVLVEEFVRQAVPQRRLSDVRDGPRLELCALVEEFNGNAQKLTWLFFGNQRPADAKKFGTNLGVTTYMGIFTDEELTLIEDLIDIALLEAPEDQFLPETFQRSLRKDTIIRTKIFFGQRYRWGKDKANKSDPAAGVRADVDQPPEWLNELIVERLIDVGLVERGWLNSIAINVYHDGTLGLHSHMDDNTRFDQPIFTLRLYSPSRLTFGAQGLGMTNPLFFVPMPRGCITVLEHDGYAANQVTHCIRPCDMAGKSAAVILRRIHPRILKAAKQLATEE